MGDDFYCEEALSGRTPVDVVIETEDVLAFRHTRPFWPVHIVVVVREHGACRVLTNLGRYQDSKHLHFHVNAGEPLRGA